MFKFILQIYSIGLLIYSIGLLIYSIGLLIYSIGLLIYSIGLLIYSIIYIYLIFYFYLLIFIYIYFERKLWTRISLDSGTRERDFLFGSSLLKPTGHQISTVFDVTSLDKFRGVLLTYYGVINE